MMLQHAGAHSARYNQGGSGKFNEEIPFPVSVSSFKFGWAWHNYAVYAVSYENQVYYTGDKVKFITSNTSFNDVLDWISIGW